jgi:hypothetical protein
MKRLALAILLLSGCSREDVDSRVVLAIGQQDRNIEALKQAVLALDAEVKALKAKKK